MYVPQQNVEARAERSASSQNPSLPSQKVSWLLRLLAPVTHLNMQLLAESIHN